MEELNEGNWGFRINLLNYGKFDLDAPEWVKEIPTLSWYSKGFVIWDADEKLVVNLNTSGAVGILDQLYKDDDWKTNGIDVSESYTSFSLPLKRKGRRKSQEEQFFSTKENVTIRIHLSPKRSAKLFSFLKLHESDIRSSWALGKFQYEHAMTMLVDILRG